MLAFLGACSSSDDDGGEPTTITGDFFPLTVDNYWNYDVTTTNNETSEVVTNSDFLFVDAQTGTSFTLKVNTDNIANGSMNAILVSGPVSQTDSTLTMDGTLALPIEGFDTTVSINDAVLYNLNASNNEVLSTFSGTVTETFEGLPIEANYELQSKKINNTSSLTVNGTSYSNVEVTEITLNLTVTTAIEVLGTTTDISILDSQEVLKIRAYFGENVGLLKAESTINYEVNAATLATFETLGIEVGLPTEASATNVQELDDYVVDLD